MPRTKGFLKGKKFIAAWKLAHFSAHELEHDFPYMYTVRHDDEDWSNPLTIEPHVVCNRYCFIAFKEQIDFPEHPETGVGDPYIDLNKTDARLLKKALGE